MKPFIPSSNELLRMIKTAEAKFDADVEQAVLRKDAQENARMERFMIAQAKANRWRRLYGR